MKPTEKDNATGLHKDNASGSILHHNLIQYFPFQ